MLPQILLKIIKIELEKTFTDQENGEPVTLNCFRNVKMKQLRLVQTLKILKINFH